MIVLLITFGSLVAMGLPILTALLGLGTGIGLAGIASHLMDMPNFATELAAMIGLGVGIDYALFIVTRFRENYLAGGDVQEAIVGAMDTAGRAVLFAGATVIIALLGQFALGVDFLYGLAVSSALAVLMTMLAALSCCRRCSPGSASASGGPASARGSAPTPRRASRSPGSGCAGPGSSSATLARVRSPGLLIMLTLASPVLALRLGNSDAGNNPPNQTTRQAYDLLAKGFGPGFNGPLQVVASLPSANDAAALASVAGALRATSDVASVSPAAAEPERHDGGVQRLSALRAAGPGHQRTGRAGCATRRCRRSRRRTEATLLVGGVGATIIDFTNVLSNKLPLFIGVVVLLSALLLLVVFRSLVIPLQAAVMNLLSIGASLGVVVAIFQWGWLGSFFNVKGGPIEAFMPVMLFAIVFGLSMDYEVFLISRIHEEWNRRGDANEAVTLRPGLHRARDHRGGDDHDLRVPLVRARRRTRAQAVRAQPRDRGLPRRVHRPLPAAAVGAAPAGPDHVGAAGLARRPAAAHRDRARGRRASTPPWRRAPDGPRLRRAALASAR